MPRKKNRKRKKKTVLSVNQSDTTAAPPRVQLDDDIDAILKQHGLGSGNSSSSPKKSPATAAKAAESKAAAAVPHHFSRLCLEAIFYPKFENEHQTDLDIRQIMLDKVAHGQGYLEVSLKHSGSLLLWSGGQRFYSKNATHNQFTAVGEILLRQHFVRAWWNETGLDDKAHYECSRYLEQHRLTLAFEVITAVLGDHGATPNRDFVVLTAVGDRANERFYSTTELMELAHRFRLPHNDSWVFTKPSSAQALFDLYDNKRETGLASDIVTSLSQTADAVVSSMYPHAVFQGDILEGFVARYVPCPNRKEALARIQQLSSASQEIMSLVPVHRADCWELVKDMPNVSAVLKTNVRSLFLQTRQSQSDSSETALQDILASDGPQRSVNRMPKSINIPSLTAPLVQSNDPETRRIAVLIRALKALHKPIKYSVIQENTGRWLVIIHVLHDTTFQKYYNSMEETDMQLFRGFVVELCENESPTCNSGLETEGTTCELDCGSNDTASFSRNRQDETLIMLKMKLLPYMVRTFCCRNGLSVLKNQGVEGFVKYTKNLLTKWGISPTSRYHWNPFFKAWAQYAQERLWHKLPDEQDIPQLTSWCYLTHLERFSAQFYSENKVPTAPITTEIEESTTSSLNEVQQMGMLVFVPGIVGCGKSTLFGRKTAVELKERLPSGRELQIRMGDLTKGRYWPQVRKEIQPQSIYLADKNVPGSDSWGYVADVCAATSTLGIPLVPDAAALKTTRVSGMRLPNGDLVAGRVHVYPFSLRYLAVCMARVIQRPPRSHPGKLDSATTRASFVVIKFFSLYRKILADEFLKKMRHKFQSRGAKLAWSPIQVPFLKENAPSLPRDLVENLMDALQVQYGYDLSHKEVQSASDPYVATLDVRLQKCIEKHKALLARMTVDEATSQQAVVDQILARVQELDSMDSDLLQDEQQNGTFPEKEDPIGRSIRLAAVSVSVNDVHALLLHQYHENSNKKSSLQSFQATILQGGKPEQILTGSHCPDKRFIPNTHVTLAHHRSVEQQLLQEMYGPWQGRKVQVQPIALLWSDSVAALEVVLSSSDGDVPKSMNEFVHVTVWCQAGSSAVEANELPDQVAQGSAQCFRLTDAASISGTVKLWK